MTIQEKIDRNARIAFRDHLIPEVESYRKLVQEMARHGKTEMNDMEMIQFLTTLANAEREAMNQRGDQTSVYLSILESYIPQRTPWKELRKWIAENMETPSAPERRAIVLKAVKDQFGDTADMELVKVMLDKWG